MGQRIDFKNMDNTVLRTLNTGFVDKDLKVHKRTFLMELIVKVSNLFNSKRFNREVVAGALADKLNATKLDETEGENAGTVLASLRERLTAGTPKDAELEGPWKRTDGIVTQSFDEMEFSLDTRLTPERADSYGSADSDEDFASAFYT